MCSFKLSASYTNAHIEKKNFFLMHFWVFGLYMKSISIVHTYTPKQNTFAQLLPHLLHMHIKKKKKVLFILHEDDVGVVTKGWGSEAYGGHLISKRRSRTTQHFNEWIKVKVNFYVMSFMPPSSYHPLP